VLTAIEARWLPAPLAARQLFWRGYAADRRGNPAQARRLWLAVLRSQPGGYYGWRAAERLGLAPPTPVTPSTSAWRALNSGQGELDALWSSGQALEAWESWRHRRRGQPPTGPQQLALEGLLRTGIGDDWTGLGQLEQASLRLPQGACAQHWQLEQDLHPRRFAAVFERAGAQERVDPQLLLAVARQESRFSPGVRSVVGAVGLLQLMPATAAELAGLPVGDTQLQQPARNAELGARYLRQLLDRWRQQPFLSVASYNAGPGAVERWRGGAYPDPAQEPELWVEAIPYPETRLYTKKVLGNHWTYRLMAATGDQACTWVQAR
jgi:soluble lytic murein transglycosylase